MNILLIALVLVICGAVISLQPTLAPGALACCAVVSLPTIFMLARSGKEKTFLLRLFIIAVLVRIVLATVIFMGNMEEFFGGIILDDPRWFAPRVAMTDGQPKVQHLSWYACTPFAGNAPCWRIVPSG